MADLTVTESAGEQTMIKSTTVTDGVTLIGQGFQTGGGPTTETTTAGSLEGAGAGTETTETSFLPVETSSLRTTSTIVLTVTPSTALGSTATVFLTVTPFTALSNSLDTTGATTLPYPSANTPIYFYPSSGLPSGAIAGIVVGAVVVLILVGLFAFLLLKRRRRRDNARRIVAANVDEPRTEQKDLPSGRLRYLDEGPTIDSDYEVPPTFNSY
jgi:hypothetical protein